MRALSIRQPYAELILRGIKTAEHLTDVKRAKRFRKPTGHPQPGVLIVLPVAT